MWTVKFPRSSGILLHITSLPGPDGIGDLGPAAYHFADFLAESSQSIWQVLPVNPTGYGDSPYQCFSAFAGNPLLIDLAQLQPQGLLTPSPPPPFSCYIDYGTVINYKLAELRRAAEAFLSLPSHPLRGDFELFCRTHSAWLDDYALFMACKDAHHGAMWSEWDPPLRRRDPDALRHARSRYSRELEVFKFCQFIFFRQWQALKAYCQKLKIRIMGDIPIYVAHDSADVWAHPELFHLNQNGKPTVVAGVPPDYFSATGQLWGNPIYRWDVLAASGYSWWIDRFRASLRLFDIVRLDHFRGFEAYWEIPGGSPTAQTGRWVKGPGSALFRALQSELGDLPILAENLGVITPEVEAIRHEFGFPGMSLLQFAFGTDPQGPSFRPHNYSRDLVAYTGGHDNDTTVGWWTSSGSQDSTRSSDDVRREREFAKAYLGFDTQPVNWVFIRAVLASVAGIGMIPLQDVLALGSEARMNLPGSLSGNWRWRYQAGDLTSELSHRLKVLSATYDR